MGLTAQTNVAQGTVKCLHYCQRWSCAMATMAMGALKGAPVTSDVAILEGIPEQGEG